MTILPPNRDGGNAQTYRAEKVKDNFKSSKSPIKQGLHNVNSSEDGLHHDYDVWLEKLAPHAPISQYQHNRTGEDNADAHMKRQIMGREVVVAITKGKLDFGPWEQIFYGEFDGNRRKRVLVKIIGE
jgi:secondary thiamine-phosphate synthase enzyme